MCLGVAVVVAVADAAPRDDLARARLLYNEGDFTGAIAAAEASRIDPELASAAALVVARSRLERYRLAGDPADLDAVRMEFSGLKPAQLTPHETLEWQIGAAETLFLEGQPGPAAEMFASLIGPSRVLLTPRDT
jgi:hypothetical protein